MKRLNQVVALTGLAVMLGFGAGRAAAQDRPGRGNFDPEQFRQRMMERYKERLEVKSDDEWKIISERIEKVTQAQRDARLGGFGGFGGGRRGGGPGGDGAQADNGGRPNRGPMAGEPNPDADALEKALEGKASPEEIKTRLAKLRDTQKEKEAKLAKAQDELRKVLSVRQEATAVLIGLLK